MTGLLVVAQAFGGLAGLALAADKAPGDAAGMPNAATTMTRAAAQAGVLSCAARIDQVSKFLGAGNEVSFLFLLPPPPRDQRLVTSAMEIDNKDVPSAYASAEFASSAQGCGANYQTVTYWPLKCEDVIAQEFSKIRQAPALGKSIATLDTGGNSRIFLMPAGTSGCITIKKELL